MYLFNEHKIGNINHCHIIVPVHRYDLLICLSIMINLMVYTFIWKRKKILLIINVSYLISHLDMYVFIILILLLFHLFLLLLYLYFLLFHLFHLLFLMLIFSWDHFIFVVGVLFLEELLLFLKVFISTIALCRMP